MDVLSRLDLSDVPSCAAGRSTSKRKAISLVFLKPSNVLLVRRMDNSREILYYIYSISTTYTGTREKNVSGHS